jgi:hypothetical protein
VVATVEVAVSMVVEEDSTEEADSTAEEEDSTQAARSVVVEADSAVEARFAEAGPASLRAALASGAAFVVDFVAVSTVDFAGAFAKVGAGEAGAGEAGAGGLILALAGPIGPDTPIHTDIILIPGGPHLTITTILLPMGLLLITGTTILRHHDQTLVRDPTAAPQITRVLQCRKALLTRTL